MSADIIQFIPRPNPNRPSLIETKEAEAKEFAASAPALFRDTAEYVPIENGPA